MFQKNSLLSKSQLKTEVKRLLLDPDRGISVAMFAELCGVSVQTLRQVFISQELLLTEYVQQRVNKGYAELKAGNVRVMKRPDNTRYVDYRKESKPVFAPSIGLRVTTEGIKLRIGLKNRHDYSEDSLDEQLRG